MDEQSKVEKKIKLFTIGHSTRSFDEFLFLLKEFNIAALIDIRRFPWSRRLPHFNRESLQMNLNVNKIEYLWFEDLGGRRSGPNLADSVNNGLRNPAFRHYADYMQTGDFRGAVGRLLSVASEKPTVVMCAEKLFWKCHRRLLSDYLIAQGVSVEHIMESGGLQSHKLSAGAIITDDLRVTYPSECLDINAPTLFDH